MGINFEEFDKFKLHRQNFPSIFCTWNANNLSTLTYNLWPTREPTKLCPSDKARMSLLKESIPKDHLPDASGHLSVVIPSSSVTASNLQFQISKYLDKYDNHIQQLTK